MDRGGRLARNLTFTDISDTTETERNKTEQALPKDLQTRLWMAQGFYTQQLSTFQSHYSRLAVSLLLWDGNGPKLAPKSSCCTLARFNFGNCFNAMGWAFAPEQGYGSNWTFLDFDREVDAHRWSAVIVSVATTFFSIVALVAVMLKVSVLPRFGKLDSCFQLAWWVR